VIGAHLNGMANLHFKQVVFVALVLAATFAAGCTTTGTTGSSSPARTTRGGGWDNFRAEVPIMKPLPASVT
jgi:hypothetical protein